MKEILEKWIIVQKDQHCVSCKHLGKTILLRIFRIMRTKQKMVLFL